MRLVVNLLSPSWLEPYLFHQNYHPTVVTHALCLDKRNASVDIHRLAGNEVAQRRGQKQHGADDVLRHLNALECAQAGRRFA